LYSLSDVDSVIYDDSEFQALFKKYWIEKRFFGAKLFITKPFSSDYEKTTFEPRFKRFRK
jgi:hypothetical protein